MAKLSIKYISTATLVPYANNARTHSEEQIGQIAASIREFGFNNPVLIDEGNNIIAGHGRVLAAQRIGLDKVPTVCLAHLSDSQRQAYILADNKIALNAGWDFDKLSEEIQALADMEFDISVVGFNEAELESLLSMDDTLPPGEVRHEFQPPEPKPEKKPAEVVSSGLTDDDQAPEPDEEDEPVVQRGDVFRMGDHRLMCGDSTQPGEVALLMLGSRADMVFTDPPYNVSIKGLGSGGDNTVIGKHGEFMMASGEMDEAEFTKFLKRVFKNLKKHSKDGSIHYICMDWRHIKEMVVAGEAYEGRVEDASSAETADSVE